AGPLRIRIRLSSFLTLSAGFLLAGCATAPGPSNVAPPRTPIATAPRWASAAEAEAVLLSLEDHRAYDPGLLEAAARDPDPGTRARAGLAVGRLGDERGAALLRQLLTDRSPETRAAAAFGCQVFADPTLTADLIPLLADSDVRVVQAA